VSREEGSGGGPPGPGRAFLRTLVFVLVSGIPADVTGSLFYWFVTRVFVMMSGLPATMTHWLTRWFVSRRPWIAGFFLTECVIAAGFLVLASTMRAGNGYRGLHELASGTRVVRLPRLGRRRVPRGRLAALRHLPERAAPAALGGLLNGVGPFAVRGAVRWDADRRVLLGEDPTLNRPVWLVLRPKGSPPPSPTRRDLGRPGRPRWLGGGEQGDSRWDAYAPQLGCSLADLAGSDGLPWADVRPILHDLADELARACADGTLPASLSIEQVWVQPDGTVQLVDPLEVSPTGSSSRSGSSTGLGSGSGSGSGTVPSGGTDTERALGLLRRTAALALEGNRRRGRGSSPSSIRAAVPVHAARMLDRLVRCPRPGDSPYTTVASVVADLEADRDKPTEVETARRAAHLGLAAVPVLTVLALLFRLTWPANPHPAVPWWLPLAVIPPFAAAWSAVTRGGLLLGLMGLSLVRLDSRPAGRWRCALRAALSWGVIVALLAASRLLGGVGAGQGARHFASWALWGLALAVTAAFPIDALLNPARTFLDRLSGTWIVPK
jgi:hypothetical protein